MEKEQIAKFVNKLNEEEQQVIRLRYGLDDNKPRTLFEVSEIMGISRERVRQIEEIAINKLRETDAK